MECPRRYYWNPTAFERFAAAGLREAHVGVASDNPNALRLYERCGMTERFRIDAYERPMAKAGGHTQRAAERPCSPNASPP